MIAIPSYLVKLIIYFTSVNIKLSLAVILQHPQSSRVIYAQPPLKIITALVKLLPLPLTQFEYFFEHTLNVKG
jgi:hypothetical protein